MKREVSAGGVIVRKNKDVLLLKDMNGAWTFPKGLIDDGETPEKACVREVKEEVGLDVTISQRIDTIEYFFTRDELIYKTVDYFLCRYDGDAIPTPQKEEGITEVKWVPFEEAIKIIGYPKTNKALLEKAKALISKL